MIAAGKRNACGGSRRTTVIYEDHSHYARGAFSAFTVFVMMMGLQHVSGAVSLRFFFLMVFKANIHLMSLHVQYVRERGNYGLLLRPLRKLGMHRPQHTKKGYS